jgi:hypothetical protein
VGLGEGFDLTGVRGRLWTPVCGLAEGGLRGIFFRQGSSEIARREIFHSFSKNHRNPG